MLGVWLWPCPHSAEGCLQLYTHSLALAMSAQRRRICAVVHSFPCSGHVCTAQKDPCSCTRIPLLWPCPHSAEGCLQLYTHSLALAMSAQRRRMPAVVHAFPCFSHVRTAALRRFPEGFPAHCLRCLSADHSVNTVTPPLYPLSESC